jgi:hypothetical protein
MRIMRLRDKFQCGTADPGRELKEIAYDVLKVEVTQTHTGPWHYCITLNNWYDSLPADRKQGFGALERVPAGQDPTWPRYKYNDFQILNFGMRLRIDMRYFPKPDADFDSLARQQHDWTPMIAGPITDMKFTFHPEEGARLEVCGCDELCALKGHDGDVDFWSVPVEDVIKKILDLAHFPCKEPCPSPSGAPRPPFLRSKNSKLAERLFATQTYLEYLQKLADRIDFEMFMEFTNVDDPGSGLCFYFEPARSKLPPGGRINPIRIERGVNLIRWTPFIDLDNQVTSVTITGRQGDLKNPAPQFAKVPANDTCEEADMLLRNELPQRTAPSAPGANDEDKERLLSGPCWYLRNRGEPNPDSQEATGQVPATFAQIEAEAAFRRKARQFLQVEVITIGLPRARAGQYIEIRGMRAPFDGFYYVEKAIHTYTYETERESGSPEEYGRERGSGEKHGFRTKLYCRRPGMPYPDPSGFGFIPR